MSNNDPTAKGTERPWRCICTDITDESFRSCPYHAAVLHLIHLKNHFPEQYQQAGFPWFPDALGNELKGEKVVEFIEFIAALVGGPLFNKEGVRRFGKHSLRATGAVHLSEMGLEVMKIQLLGRWLCGIVLHYCRLAPLATTAEDYKRGKDKQNQSSSIKTLTTKTVKMQQSLDYVTTVYEKQLADLKQLIDKVEAQSRPHEFVQNRKSGKTHKVLTRFSEVGLEAVTYCNYKYGKSHVRMLRDIEGIPRKILCSTCLPRYRDAPSVS